MSEGARAQRQAAEGGERVNGRGTAGGKLERASGSSTKLSGGVARSRRMGLGGRELRGSSDGRVEWNERRTRCEGRGVRGAADADLSAQLGVRRYSTQHRLGASCTVQLSLGGSLRLAEPWMSQLGGK